MMIANPTAASAAATAITMKTNNCPVTSLCRRENAIRVRLTALSISSMHINSAMTLRWMSTPTTPMVNNTALSARYQESGIMFQFRRLWGTMNGTYRTYRTYETYKTHKSHKSYKSYKSHSCPPGSNGDLLFVFFFFRLRGQRLLDALDIFFSIAAREQHRADNRHQDQYRSGFERDHIFCEHP